MTEQAELNPVRSEDDPRVKMINVEILRYKDRAKQLLMKEYPELREAKRNNDRIIKSIQRGKDPSELEALTFEF
jgi:hypothetical protein